MFKQFINVNMLLWYFILNLFFFINCDTIEDVIQKDPDIKQFAQLFKLHHPGVGFSLGGAVFAPTDKAFEKANIRNKNFDLYIPSHLTTKEIVDLEKAPKTCETYFGVPLRLTRFYNPNRFVYEYYINNAKILNYPNIINTGKVVYQLYKIDELIDPVIYDGSRILTAYELINEPHLYQQKKIVSNIINFGEKINSTGQAHHFNNPNVLSTYFVPIETYDMLNDENIINAHVIPNMTFFTRTFGNYSVMTVANNQDVSINVTIERERLHSSIYDYNPINNPFLENKFHSENRFFEEGKIYVKATVERYNPFSNTLVTDGITYSEIILPNVPVKNGVVHFIEKPLCTITTTTAKILTELSKSHLSNFYRFVRKFQNFFDLISSPEDKTLFAFTNSAFERVYQKIDLLNSSTQEEILKLHLSLQMKLNSHQMKMGEFRKLTSLSKLKDNVLHATNEDVFNRSALYVDCHGVKAKVIEANILAIDGNIHIIDKVLGIPYQTVMEKLQSDPFLWRTYNVSKYKHENWALKLNNTYNKATFTLFAPSENAWKNLELNHPSYYKQINRHYYPRNTIAILDRHLILNQAYTFNDLAKLNEVKTLRTTIKLRSEGSKITLEWEGVQAVIERPDIHAINGVIHAIDRILFKDSDMKVTEEEARINGLPKIKSSCLFIILSIIIQIFYLILI